MKTFSERLATCLEKGQMAPGDLKWWFGRSSYATTDAWLHKRRTPRPYGAGAEAWRRLGLLEDAIRTKKGFPVPHDLSLTARPRHIRKLFDDYSAAVPRKHSARGRLQMRNGVQ